jgi:putative queuosine salvage protein
MREEIAENGIGEGRMNSPSRLMGYLSPDTPTTGSIPERVRSGCAWVAARSRSVEIDEAGIPAYAAALPRDAADEVPTHTLADADRETRAALAICANAINFGSGWWPTIRKRPGLSGFLTMLAGITERFEARGPWPAEQLISMDAEQIAAVLRQDPGHPLMTQFAAALRDVGTHVLVDHDGNFAAVADAGGDSAVTLVNLLGGWSAFGDVSTYAGRPIPFFKRAQLAVADLQRAAVTDPPDLNQLTAFADNLIPHVLRVDGILRLDPSLTSRIEDGELIEHESPEEIELRACAVHAVELLAQSVEGQAASDIDAALWNRGASPRYKVLPRPRSRNTAY